ncbi:MAG: cardiolipin synthase [Bacilli bacterium]
MKSNKIKTIFIIILKITMFIFLLGLQLFLIYVCFAIFNKYIVWLVGGFAILTLIIIIYIINDNSNPMYKIAWLIPILVFPILGSVLYLYTNNEIMIKGIINKQRKVLKGSVSYAVLDNDVMGELDRDNRYIGSLCTYIYKYGTCPTYKNTECMYLEIGEVYFEEVKKELLKAKKFIFMEFFIIADNSMWCEILEILKDKVKQGVEVKVMTDGIGSLFTLPYGYEDVIRSYGIDIKIYAPLKPLLSGYHNYRDHRKIIVIDNEVSFTGGINIADEYINKKIKHGHWKDTGIKLTGEATFNFTLMFLQTWNLMSSKPTMYSKYLGSKREVKCNSFVTPYGDNPFDNENISEQVYLDIINYSCDYLYITTPYLVIDYTITEALKHASKRGVDVKIIVPHIPDKKFVYYLAVSYYKELTDAGVKIYEYTPGFIHAKMFVSDDIKAVVGTINLDYRSLYLHFECGVLLYKDKSIKSIRDDFIRTLDKSMEITKEKYKKIPLYKKIFGKIYRFIAPLS